MAIHDLLIFIHALGGGLSFISGCIVIIPSLRPSARSTWLALFLVSLTTSIIALLGVVVYDWPQLFPSQQIIFGGLCLLALYMAWRAFQAYQVFRDHSLGWMPQFIDHIGFNLISLFDGFVIISAIDLGAPGWLVGITAVLGVVVGIRLVNQVKIAEKNRAGSY